MNDPTPGPPEYKVYRSRRKPLARGGDLDALRQRLSRNRDGDPLTFDQTARRWLGGILTVATLGLPLLVTGDRRSLTDGLSGSATYPEDGPA